MTIWEAAINRIIRDLRRNQGKRRAALRQIRRAAKRVAIAEGPHSAQIAAMAERFERFMKD